MNSRVPVITPVADGHPVRTPRGWLVSDADFARMHVHDLLVQSRRQGDTLRAAVLDESIRTGIPVCVGPKTPTVELEQWLELLKSRPDTLRVRV